MDPVKFTLRALIAALGLAMLVAAFSGCDAPPEGSPDAVIVSVPLAAAPAPPPAIVKLALPTGQGASGWWRTEAGGGGVDGAVWTASFAETADHWIYGGIRRGEWANGFDATYEVAIQLYTDGIFRGTALAWDAAGNLMTYHISVGLGVDDVLRVVFDDGPQAFAFDRAAQP